MKREAPRYDAPSSKRARHDGSNNDAFSNIHPDRQHSQMKQQHDGSNPLRHSGHGHQGSRDGRSTEYGQKHRYGSQRPAPVPQDPVAVLVASLRSLTAHPDMVESVLGPSVLQNATQLLASLSSDAITPKAWLDVFHPPSDKASPALTGPHTDLEHNAPLEKPSSLPPLPYIPDGPYLQATFTHKSTTQHDRVSGIDDLTYEKLEFLGDAYIEIVATRIIFDRYPNLPAGRQAQTRERLVKNDTLAQFSSQYRFHEKIQASDMKHAKNGGVKILADVFEAYVAAVVLSDPQDGFKRVEDWLTNLWAPILMQESATPYGAKPLQEYNPNAKQDLQKKILGHDTKLEYLEDRPMEQSKHAQKYFIGLYLTGYGHEKKKIGYGEGRNKVEAGNRAAMCAFQDHGSLVADAAEQLENIKERKRLEREEREKRQAVGV